MIKITGNNRNSLLASVAQINRHGGYWHRGPIRESPGDRGWYSYSVMMDRIDLWGLGKRNAE
jgi:hypothetical protein